MAIDTANKRQSTVGMGLLFLAIGPVPDGTIDAADRVHTAGFYSGIAVSVPASVAPSANPIIMDPHGRCIAMKAHGRTVVMDPHGRSITMEPV